MNMQEIQTFGLPFMGPHMEALWLDATEKEQHSWQLPTIVARSVGGDLDKRTLTAVTAAIGCLQLSIIIVDDMLDDDEKGLFRQIGHPKAANMAQAFQAAAMEMISFDSRIVGELAHMVRLTSIGQHMDSNFERFSDVQAEETYWETIQQKSCPYYIASFKIAAFLTNASGEIIEKLGQLGNILGRMIQVTDDVFDIMAKPARPDWWFGSNVGIVYMSQTSAWSEFKQLIFRVQRQENMCLESAQALMIKEGLLAYTLYILEEMGKEASSLMVGMTLQDEVIGTLFEQQINSIAQFA